MSGLVGVGPDWRSVVDGHGGDGDAVLPVTTPVLGLDSLVRTALSCSLTGSAVGRDASCVSWASEATSVAGSDACGGAAAASNCSSISRVRCRAAASSLACG